MSDYIENQDHSMQLAASEDDPFAYDWDRLREEVDQPLSALFSDITPASLQEPIDLDADDWSGLADALENGPWREVFHWPADYQGAEAQLDDRGPIVHEVDDMSDDLPARFICDHPTCNSKEFKRNGDLARHQRLHQDERDFLCTAEECRRTFTRADKLRDHIRRGHDEDTLFACLNSDCQAVLTKDVLPVHKLWDEYGMYHRLNSYRQCPLPRCGFKVKGTALAGLQQHLLERHDLKGRERFGSLIADRGYDYESAHIVCPICPNRLLISTHTEFEKHFVDNHCGSRRPYRSVDSWEPTVWIYSRPGSLYDTQTYEEEASSEVRKHRRTVLSLMPSFYDHPVWNDIAACPQQA